MHLWEDSFPVRFRVGESNLSNACCISLLRGLAMRMSVWKGGGQDLLSHVYANVCSYDTCLQRMFQSCPCAHWFCLNRYTAQVSRSEALKYQCMGHVTLLASHHFLYEGLHLHTSVFNQTCCTACVSAITGGSQYLHQSNYVSQVCRSASF